MFSVKKDYLTVNSYSRPGRKLKDVKGIVIHWTANESRGADAKANRNFFENRKRGKTGYGSAHYIIDNEEILLCMPESEMAYHVGATSYKTSQFGSYPNNSTIGIEMCVNSDGDFSVVYEQTLQLTKHLAEKYGLDMDKDVVRHYDVTGKNCPAYFTSDHWGKTNNSYAKKFDLGNNADAAWEDFINKLKGEQKTKFFRVRKSWKDASSQKGAFEQKDNAIALAKSLGDDYQVFNDDGKVIYTNEKPEPKPEPVKEEPTTVKYPKKGDSGSTVKGLQKDLIEAGYDLSQYGADGSFGPETDQALRQFQKDHGLAVDGQFGPKTQAKMKEVLAAPDVKVPNEVLQYGDKGAGVKQLQKALNEANFNCGTPDGSFGPKTLDALKRFQSVYTPYSVDGSFGPKTRAALKNKLGI